MVLFGNAASVAFAAAQRRRPCAAARASSSCSRSIRNRCRVLVAPDSGVLTAAYYLDDDVPARRDLAVVRPAPGHPEAGLPVAESACCATSRCAGRARTCATSPSTSSHARVDGDRRCPHPRSGALTPAPPASRASMRGARRARACSRSLRFASCSGRASTSRWSSSAAYTYGRSVAFGLALVFALWLVARRDLLRRRADPDTGRVPAGLPSLAVGRLVQRVVLLVAASRVLEGGDRHRDRLGPRHRVRSSTSAARTGVAFRAVATTAVGRRRAPRGRRDPRRAAPAPVPIPRRCSCARTAAWARSRPTSCSWCRSCRCCSRRGRWATAPARCT